MNESCGRGGERLRELRLEGEGCKNDGLVGMGWSWVARGKRHRRLLLVPRVLRCEGGRWLLAGRRKARKD